MLASVLHTVIIYAVVIFAMRLMGKRQLGELQPSELVTTFMISNVASICIDEPDLPILDYRHRSPKQQRRIAGQVIGGG